MSREVKVGALVLTALAVFAAGIFLVGERENVFRLKNRYSVRFESAAGLAAGNPVQLNGVTVGKVQQVVLPLEIDEPLIRVWLTIDRRYGSRVREDSLARIKTLGLLGDKYIEITSGSPQTEIIPSGGEIPAAPPTDVDQLIASGEDVVDNVVAITISLRSILDRMEKGQGILGELTTDTDAGRRAKEALLVTLETVRGISGKLDRGEGSLARLINEGSLIERADETLDRLDSLLRSLESRDSALGALVNDPQTRQNVERIVGNLAEASDSFQQLGERLESDEGLLPRLLNDEELARRLGDDLSGLLENLRVLTERLERGDGTLGQLIQDPEIYQALNDILVGINESKLLRWLIRNRQKSGIRVRYREELERLEQEEAAGAAPGR